MPAPAAAAAAKAAAQAAAQSAKASAVDGALGRGQGLGEQADEAVQVAIKILLGLLALIILLFAVIATAFFGGGGTSGPPVLNSPIPVQFQQVFVNAGSALNVNPYLLASVAAQESNFGSPASHRVNSSGCAGFMQICVGGKGGDTWDESIALTEHPAQSVVVRDAFNVAPGSRPSNYGNASPTHPDYNDPFDAVMGAAVVLRGKVGGRSIPQLDAVAHQALCGYYGACGDAAANYADSVMSRALAWQSQHALPDTVGAAPVPGGPISVAAGLGPAIVQAAVQQQGVLYQWGGGDQNGPTFGIAEGNGQDTHDLGFDCSGLVLYAVYQATHALVAARPQGWAAPSPLVLPHNAAAQYQALRTHIPFEQLQPGDIVFFDNFDHVGIYVGNGQVVNAPQTYTAPGVRGRVEFDTITSGWYRNTFIGAARVTFPGAS